MAQGGFLKPDSSLTDTFRSLLRFDSEEGRIWLDEERMVLVHGTEMRALRRELIESLGMERARRMLMRMGFIAGQKDADTVYKVEPDADDLEAFMLGPESHMLTGQVKVEAVKVEIDRERGHFHCIVNWMNSFEADVFQAEFGIAEQPVCWVQLGYASGFTSRFLGRTVIYRETQCVGCGAAHCRIEGRPVEEWPDGDELLKMLEPERIVDELSELHSQVNRLRRRIEEDRGFVDIVGSSEKLLTAVRLVERVARSKVTVLLLGETGVGKDLFARALHRASTRSGGPMIAVNCAAIPRDLIEAELFGVMKGAYTGADQDRPGRFERAHGGTLFLDEIGELSLQAQAALLRVLQEGELERVGDSRTRKVDVRLVAATNEDLEKAVKEGRFRADLLYRLNVYSVTVPPLRERLDDLPDLIRHFVDKYNEVHGKKVRGTTDMAMSLLRGYDWPGNIRELANTIERGVILAENNGLIEASDIFPHVAVTDTSAVLGRDGTLVEQEAGGTQVPGDDFFSSGLSLEEFELGLMRQALNRSNGNVSQAARLLGLTRPALDYRLRKAGISAK